MTMNRLKRRLPFLTETRLHLAVLAILLVVPFISNSPYIIFMASAALFYSMVVLGLNVINNAGVWNLAHATFLALGGYITGFLAKTYGLSPWIGIPIGAVLAGLVSVIVMVPALRLHQHYLMIATFILALIGTITFTNWTWRLNPWGRIPASCGCLPWVSARPSRVWRAASLRSGSCRSHLQLPAWMIQSFTWSC
jgi:ABC-type branched-subunit amino acid transport system permease subunit